MGTYDGGTNQNLKVPPGGHDQDRVTLSLSRLSAFCTVQRGSLGSGVSAGFTWEACTQAVITSTLRVVRVVSSTRKVTFTRVSAIVPDASGCRPSHQSGSSEGVSGIPGAFKADSLGQISCCIV